MNKMLNNVLLVLLVAVVSACGKKDQSPRIVCDVNGTITDTGFTFEEFRATLIAEHGAVDVKPNESLTTRSVSVQFKSLPDGRLLATRVVILKSKEEAPPAVLFGLAKQGEATRPAAVSQSNRADRIQP